MMCGICGQIDCSSDNGTAATTRSKHIVCSLLGSQCSGTDYGSAAAVSNACSVHHIYYISEPVSSDMSVRKEQIPKYGTDFDETRYGIG